MENNLEKAQLSFGMVKPEGMLPHITKDIHRRIENSGLLIIYSEKKKLSEEQFKYMYGHVKNKRPKIYDKLMEILTENEVEIMLIGGYDSVNRLLELRGASNPSDAKPGTIRGDYAKDQNYDKLYEKEMPSQNFFHAADTEIEANQYLEFFFGIDTQSL